LTRLSALSFIWSAIKILYSFTLAEILPYILEFLGHNYIGTENLLLGLLREGESVAARVLENLGADPTNIRTQASIMFSFIPFTYIYYIRTCFHLNLCLCVCAPLEGNRLFAWLVRVVTMLVLEVVIARCQLWRNMAPI
jgi:hypothetical protein